MAKEAPVWRIIQQWLDLQRFPPSQSKLGEAVGVSRSAVSDWKSGKTRPAPDTLKRLAALMAPTLGKDVYLELVMAVVEDMGYIPRALTAAELEIAREVVHDQSRKSPPSQHAEEA